MPLDDSSSLRDLFSQRNTKKRPFPFKEEKKKEAAPHSNHKEIWISNHKKVKRNFQEDSQLADKFEQMSQAVFNGSKVQRKDIASSERESIGNYALPLEDSSSNSVFNFNIKFDQRQA